MSVEGEGIRYSSLARYKTIARGYASEWVCVWRNVRVPADRRILLKKYYSHWHAAIFLPNEALLRIILILRLWGTKCYSHNTERCGWNNKLDELDIITLEITLLLQAS